MIVWIPILKFYTLVEIQSESRYSIVGDSELPLRDYGWLISSLCLLSFLWVQYWSGGRGPEDKANGKLCVKFNVEYPPR